MTYQNMVKRWGTSTSAAAKTFLRGSDAADNQFPYVFNVIWWVMFMARTLIDFS
jgi:hypothetical protein